MTVEILYFEGCPAYRDLLPRVRRIVAAAGGDPEGIVLRGVETLEAAEEARFLGSPTVRVDRVDVDPGAQRREDFGLKCRIYRSEEGQTPTPPDSWLKAAIAAEHTGEATR